MQVFFDINDLCRYFMMVIDLWYYFIVMPLMWIYIHVILPIKNYELILFLLYFQRVYSILCHLFLKIWQTLSLSLWVLAFTKEISIINFLYWSFCWDFPLFLILLWVFSLSYCLICLWDLCWPILSSYTPVELLVIDLVSLSILIIRLLMCTFLLYGFWAFWITD